LSFQCFWDKLNIFIFIISWLAAEIIGPYNVYPEYGDNTGTWAADCCDRPIEYITVLQYLVFFFSFRHKIAWTIIFELKVHYSFTITSNDGLVYYLIFRSWLKPSTLFNRTNIIHMTTSVSWSSYILFDIQDYSVYYIIPPYIWMLSFIGW
jgi:hypothetical protein